MMTWQTWGSSLTENIYELNLLTEAFHYRLCLPLHKKVAFIVSSSNKNKTVALQLNQEEQVVVTEL